MNSSDINTNKWSMLSRLRRAINKVMFLLELSINRWRLLGSVAGLASSRRQLSFNDREGLKACCDEIDSQDSGSSRGVAISRTGGYSSGYSSGSSSTYSPDSLSSQSSEEDIDRKAEAFINNFRRQLFMERQVSMQLKYHRSYSLESQSP